LKISFSNRFPRTLQGPGIKQPEKLRPVHKDSEADDRGTTSWLSVIIGWLVALGAALILSRIVDGVVGATARAAGPAAAGITESGVVGLVSFLITLLLAFLIGGYTAGRLASRQGVKHGVLVALVSLVITIVLAILGELVGVSLIDNLSGVTLRDPPNHAPQNLGTISTVSGILALLLPFIAGGIGGSWGEPVRKRPIKVLLVGVLALMFLGAVSTLVWPYTSYSASSEAQEALKRADLDNGDWYAFDSTDGRSAPSVGVILYPGKHVSAEAYALIAQQLSEESEALVVVTRAPLNLPILDQDAAADVIAAYPDVKRWVVGGHSLGGVAAASFTGTGPSRVDGLLLWASSPSSGNTNLSNAKIEVTSVYGSQDGLVDRQSIAEARTRLPVSTSYVEIEGANHSYFGEYGAQRGDGSPLLSREEARKAIVGASVDLIEQVQ
jgi:dienelactone hydrolase